jgi:hypothetical protein
LPAHYFSVHNFPMTAFICPLLFSVDYFSLSAIVLCPLHIFCPLFFSVNYLYVRYFYVCFFMSAIFMSAIFMSAIFMSAIFMPAIFMSAVLFCSLFLPMSASFQFQFLSVRCFSLSSIYLCWLFFVRYFSVRYFSVRHFFALKRVFELGKLENGKLDASSFFRCHE